MDNKLIQDEMAQTIIETAKDIAIKEGIKTITVRKILKELGITNRVFYNRFHNIDEVLEIVYKQIAQSLHDSIELEYTSEKEFFEDVFTLMENTLKLSYQVKESLNQFIFEQDSLSDENFNWWFNEIKRIMEYAIKEHFIRPVEVEQISYALWCFIRGFNADALSRKIPLEKALSSFRLSLEIFIQGLK